MTRLRSSSLASHPFKSQACLRLLIHSHGASLPPASATFEDSPPTMASFQTTFLLQVMVAISSFIAAPFQATYHAGQIHQPASLGATERHPSTGKFKPPLLALRQVGPEHMTMRLDDDSSGYTLHTCITDKECRGDRQCLHVNLKDGCHAGTIECICVPTKSTVCTRCGQCEEHELCARHPDYLGNGKGLCSAEYTVAKGILVEVGCESYPDVTPIPPFRNEENGEVGKDEQPTPKAQNPSSATPSGSTKTGNDRDGCIDATLMAHLPASAHVFCEHRTAGVLCDVSGSCATRGHMVVFQQTAMTMAAYCALVHGGCAKRVRRVNSPRFALALRVPSKSTDLEFTAFAASFETVVEALALAIAIRIGL